MKGSVLRGQGMPSTACKIAVTGVGAAWLVVLLSAPAMAQTPKPILSCESLTKQVVPDGAVISAKLLGPGEYKLPAKVMAAGVPGARPGQNGPGGPPAGAANAAAKAPDAIHAGPFLAPADEQNHFSFCLATLQLTPSADSDIHVEVWLPSEKWNGKLVGIGDFGWAGDIQYDGMLEAVEKGYAAVSTDTGHPQQHAEMGSFALGHPDKVVDYGYRAVHEMTLKAKALIQAYYGQGPKHSYWNGCSLGGQQGLTEVTRFPQDYDGAIIGAPASPIDNLNAMQIMGAVMIHKNPAMAIPMSKMRKVHEYILNKCDLLDGVKDGMLDNPEACPFSVAEITCKSGAADDCLTAPQAQLLDQMYKGFPSPTTGERLVAGPALGSELGFGMAMAADKPMNIGLALFQYLIFQDPNWDWTQFDHDRDIAFADKVLGTINVVKTTNFKPFFDRGGKLLMYHGWNDMWSPRQNFDYFDAIVKTSGPKAAEQMKVFGIPGMGHCSGGDGCDAFDRLAIMDKWIEGGPAPERIDTARLDKERKVLRTHPACAYPAYPKYKGTGNVNNAASYACVKK